MVYVLLLVALASIAAAAVLRHYLPLLRHHGLPKGSFGWPFIGETIGFLHAHPSNTAGGFLQEHVAKYGTVFKSHLFGSPAIVSCDEELNHFVLHNEERLFECSYPGAIRTILGESSALVVTGERHRQIRSMFLALVASTGLKASYVASVDESARSLIASWSGRKTISFCEEARKFPYKVAFLLDSLLAGHETTSVLLSILVYFIGKSPSIIDQLKKEHEAIRATKGKDEPLTPDDYRKMEYTLRVINEGLRCGNIVKLVHRKVLKDVTYKGYVIPAGWKVLPILGAVHVDASHHLEPEQFQPGRWEGLSQPAGKSFAPFGGGLRLCPGSEIVKVEAAFFLHHLVLNYRWRMDEEDVPMLHQYVEFKKGLPIQLEPISG
ncbi:hypothetical protein PVAP13_9NG517700 [Panicum virgatum]|uniref:Cytochrome P450 724B1 n=1 Tax=Panicum virgatum TaxID=38727 RepID=A0A8T0MS88_PANVG|nr:hypothetical protein PVAP13_9NG517700 [Panicum virgatum]